MFKATLIVIKHLNELVKLSTSVYYLPNSAASMTSFPFPLSRKDTGSLADMAPIIGKSQAPVRPGYPYSELAGESPQIRLVTLQPGSWSAEVDCDVRVVSFGQVRPEFYEALSYVWGDPNVKVPIRLNGHRFSVTTNLWLALRRLRHRSTPRVLWVDAICINQDDNDEKSRQIVLMGDIYKRCQRGIVWLGEGPETPRACVSSPTAVRAFALLEMLSADKHLSALPCFITIAGKRTEGTVEERRMKTSSRYKAHFRAANWLLGVEWWTRVWVIQEVTLPKQVEVLFASEHLSYATIKRAAQAALAHCRTCCNQDKLRLAGDIAYQFFDTVRALFEGFISAQEALNQGVKVTLLQLRRQFYMCQATDMRDLFYGLLGLVTDWPSGVPLQPDYRIPQRDAIVNAAAACLSKQGNGMLFLMGERRLRLLPHKSREQETLATHRRETLDLPSWIPDATFFSMTPQQGIMEQRRLEMYCMFAASGSLGQDASEFAVKEDGSLHAQTILVDKIASVGETCDPLEDVPQTLRAAIAWIRMVGLELDSWPRQLPLADSAADMLWRAFCNDLFKGPADSDSGLKMTNYRQATEQDYTRLLLLVGQYHSFRTSVFHTLLSKLATFSFPFRAAISDALTLARLGSRLVPLLKGKPFISSMIQNPAIFTHLAECVWRRRGYMTEGGRFGLASGSAEIGDEVHIVLGCPAPFVLRQLKRGEADGHPSYVVIGNCYQHGIMYGEALGNGRQEAVRTVAIY